MTNAIDALIQALMQLADESPEETLDMLCMGPEQPIDVYMPIIEKLLDNHTILNRVIQICTSASGEEFSRIYVLLEKFSGSSTVLRKLFEQVDNHAQAMDSLLEQTREALLNGDPNSEELVRILESQRPGVSNIVLVETMAAYLVNEEGEDPDDLDGINFVH